VIVDAGEYVGEPGQRIDVIELCRRKQRSHRRSLISTAFGAGKELRFSSQRKSAKGVPHGHAALAIRAASRARTTPSKAPLMAESTSLAGALAQGPYRLRGKQRAQSGR
jgi:hypothetical protein